MCEEIFGPVLTVYVYEDTDYAKTLELLDQTSEYALTGAVFAKGARGGRPSSQCIEAVCRQLLHQRQANRCSGRPTTLWRS